MAAFWGIVLNVLVGIIGLALAIAFAKEEKNQYSDNPILKGIIFACVWAILQIFVNLVVIYG